jgi:Ca2+/Na+ antiporter
MSSMAILTLVSVSPLEILTVLVVSLYVIYIYFLLASPVHNHKKDMIFLMDLMETEHMYENFDTDLRGSFREHKELLEEKDRRLQDTQDNETVYPFTLRCLLKNVEPDLLKCIFFIILNFTALINHIIIVRKTNLSSLVASQEELAILECLIQFYEFLERMKGEKDLLNDSKKYTPLLSFDL